MTNTGHDTLELGYVFFDYLDSWLAEDSNYQLATNLDQLERILLRSLCPLGLFENGTQIGSRLCCLRKAKSILPIGALVYAEVGKGHGSGRR